MGDLILLETAVLPGRGVANCSVSPLVHAVPAAVAAGASLSVQEVRIRAGNESSVRESRPSSRTREDGRQTSPAAGAPRGRVAQASEKRLRGRNSGAVQRLHGWSRGSDRRLHARPAFFFDLACPLSYITAERVERLLGEVDWVPTPSVVLRNGETPDQDALTVQAIELARAARLPLVWPDRFPAPVPRALRAATYASEIGAGARFAIAASRLAFCGGFDLEKRSVLTDVAGAAGIPVGECLAAADEDWRDEELLAAASLLSSQGVSDVPVVGIQERWFDGVQALGEAAAWLRRD